ncbi:hypothetical protein [Tsukamurella ocularis]|uniref:hypothetical protein n=1 Tax=Tsukamurella ocularis TaxID=1970234 RepID=UPI00216918C6|nr:hypothetical protein [Tsukamurella ocularis]MCS3779038.1 hypothetical protein [Tsukamurella ocularis]MCS3787342.1 hypothetical protein [Tsukamurella ocularis]MCS3851721.1 hypothetical protein [Tsukamurella ocularis]
MFRPAHPEAALRGAAVGTVSFAASLTAHAFAMRGGGSAMSGHSMPGHDMSAMPGHDMSTMTGHAMAGHAMHSMPAMDAPAVAATPSIPTTSVLLLAVVCALLGVLAARPRTAGPRAAAALLLLGQGAGHLALGVTMGHLAVSPTMAAAHLVAAVTAGAAIAGAEHALRVALATLAPLTPTWRERSRTVVTPVWTFRAVPLPVLARHGALRAPPA